jgi:hypothetical protein
MFDVPLSGFEGVQQILEGRTPCRPLREAERNSGKQNDIPTEKPLPQIDRIVA